MRFIHTRTGTRIDLEGGYLFEMLRLCHGANLSIALTIVEPGGRLERHFHRLATEVYLGVAGDGQIIVGDTSAQFGVGDVLQIDPGETHFAEASERGLCFHAITVPAFDPSDYYPVGKMQ